MFLTSSVIFDWFDIRSREGNYVLFIVYTNLICGLLYLAAAFALWRNSHLATVILTISTILLLLGLGGLFLHINSGGIYEQKTVGAMFFRTAITALFLLISYFVLKNKSRKINNQLSN
ncbi:MAG: hypothetical protein IPM74_14525 [Crocinitomicaceae bacterium]|nr:hypothetical protein [Crocinitomicaceae bacterium]MBK8927085.1 hypothetical protein [Crocinitomicaceae bacterium]